MLVVPIDPESSRTWNRSDVCTHLQSSPRGGLVRAVRERVTPPPYRWVGRTCQGRLATSERKHEEHGKALRNQNTRSTEKPSATEYAGRGYLKEPDLITNRLCPQARRQHLDGANLLS